MKEICSAIFRTLPPISTNNAVRHKQKHRAEDICLDFHPEVQHPTADPDWDLVEAAYDSIHTLLCSDGPDALLLDGFLDLSFVRKLFDNLLNSFDPREAESIGELLPLIWSRSDGLKNALWMAATETLSRFLAESRAHISNEISEILSFLASKMEELPRQNRISLLETLVRLHKPINFAQYDEPLRLCFTNILEQDDDLSNFVISRILKHWPTELPSKEALMLQEIHDLIINVPSTKLFCSIGPLFRRLDNCLRSTHYLVVTRALEVLDTGVVWRIAEMDKTLISIFGGGLKAATDHWNLGVMGEAIDVQRIYLEMGAESASD